MASSISTTSATLSNSTTPITVSGQVVNAITGEPWNTDDGGNVDFRTPFPGYSPNAALFESAGTSAYDALETHLEKRLRHGVSVGASYTFGHEIGRAHV